MKKKLLSALCMVLAVGMTGCGFLPELPEITEEQTELVTEYAAGLLLKYNSNGALLDEDALAKEEAEEEVKRERLKKMRESAARYLELKEAAKTAKQQSKDEDSETPKKTEVAENIINDIADFCELGDFDITYEGYELCDTYPNGDREDAFLTASAEAGKQLCVLKFDVANVSGGASDFDMFGRRPSFALRYNDGQKANQQMTLLLDDMSAYKGEFQAGDHSSLILLFEVEDAENSLSDMKLNVKYGGSSSTVLLN